MVSTESLLASLPILTVIGALVGRASSLVAATLGLAVLVPVAAFAFPLAPSLIAGETSRWLPVLAEVLLIVAGGIAFAEIGRRAGSQDALSRWLRGALGVGVGPVLAIVHGLTPLAESLTGFGIGAAIAVPLLSALGLPGRKAAIVGLLGLCTVPWGSMGPGTLIAAELSGVPFSELGVVTAAFSFPVFLGVGVAAVLVTAGRERLLRNLTLAAGSAAILWLAVAVSNILLGTAPAGAVGGAVSLLVHLAIRRAAGAAIGMPPEARRAAVPYAVLLGGVLAASILVRLSGASDSILRYLASPAVWLAVAVVVAVIAAPRLPPGGLRATIMTWLHVGPATALFIGIGATMSATGMSDAIAQDLSRLGPVYLFALPFVAALGGFVTGSNSGANAMLAGPQADIARSLGLDVTAAISIHNTTAALAIMAAPARVELAARLADSPQARSEIQRTILLVITGITTVYGVGMLVAGLLFT